MHWSYEQVGDKNKNIYIDIYMYSIFCEMMFIFFHSTFCFSSLVYSTDLSLNLLIPSSVIYTLLLSLLSEFVFQLLHFSILLFTFFDI